MCETSGSGNKSGVFFWGSVSPSECNEIQVVWQEGPGHIYMHVEGRSLFSLAHVSLFSSVVCFLLLASMFKF